MSYYSAATSPICKPLDPAVASLFSISPKFIARSKLTNKPKVTRPQRLIYVLAHAFEICLDARLTLSRSYLARPRTLRCGWKTLLALPSRHPELLGQHRWVEICHHDQCSRQPVLPTLHRDRHSYLLRSKQRPHSNHFSAIGRPPITPYSSHTKLSELQAHLKHKGLNAEPPSSAFLLDLAIDNKDTVVTFNRRPMDELHQLGVPTLSTIRKRVQALF